jgi:hypothetical protein
MTLTRRIHCRAGFRPNIREPDRFVWRQSEVITRVGLPSAAVGAVLLVTAAGCGNQTMARAPAPTAQRLLGAGVAFDPGSGGVIAFGGQQRVGRYASPSRAMWRWAGDRWEPVAVTDAPPARSAALMAADPRTHTLLLFGGQAQTTTAPSCPSPAGRGQTCTGAASPVRVLSDTWVFTGGAWRQAGPGRGAPQLGQLLADDPALHAVVLTGQSPAQATEGGPGTWQWTGRRWRPLSATGPDGADSLGYDPISRRLLAYGGQQPFTPGPDMGAAASAGYSRTWAFNGTAWVELNPPQTPGQVPGVLAMSPGQHRLLLITTLSQVWAWTGRTWQPYRASGGPAASHPPWTGATVSAATDTRRHQIVLLVTSPGSSDQTWTLSGHTWTYHPATP